MTLTKSERALASMTILVAQPLVWFLAAWALATLWGWYAVPMGAPVITKTTALGVFAIRGLFVKRDKRDLSEDEKLDDGLAGTIYSIVVPLICLGVGGLGILIGR